MRRSSQVTSYNRFADVLIADICRCASLAPLIAYAILPWPDSKIRSGNSYTAGMRSSGVIGAAPLTTASWCDYASAASACLENTSVASRFSYTFFCLSRLPFIILPLSPLQLCQYFSIKSKIFFKIAQETDLAPAIYR